VPFGFMIDVSFAMKYPLSFCAYLHNTLFRRSYSDFLLKLKQTKKKNLSRAEEVLYHASVKQCDSKAGEKNLYTVKFHHVRLLARLHNLFQLYTELSYFSSV